jgi:hypothetical protein
LPIGGDHSVVGAKKIWVKEEFEEVGLVFHCLFGIVFGEHKLCGLINFWIVLDWI